MRTRTIIQESKSERFSSNGTRVPPVSRTRVMRMVIGSYLHISVLDGWGGMNEWDSFVILLLGDIICYDEISFVIFHVCRNCIVSRCVTRAIPSWNFYTTGGLEFWFVRGFFVSND